MHHLPQNDLKLEPVYGDEEADIQQAVELSIKEQAERTQGPARPVFIREPDSGRIQPLPDVQGKGKEKVSDEQVALDLLTLHTPKKKSPAEQYIIQRRTPTTTKPSGHAESPSLYAKLGLTDSETESDEEASPEINVGTQDKGQAGPNPGEQDEGHAGPNPGIQDEDYSCEDLGKLQPTADIGIFVGYAPSRKGYRIYNKRTRRIMKTIHVQFDELTEQMATVQLSTGSAPSFLTPGLITVSAPVSSAGTPSSTTIDQDAPSPSHSPSSLALQSPSLHQGFAADSTLMEDNPFAHVDNHPFINVFAPEPSSEAESPYVS
ncbi:integrase, catalytic region, zinc finger, CCHC-type containing protein [Tanacetum coccineum]